MKEGIAELKNNLELLQEILTSDSVRSAPALNGSSEQIQSYLAICSSQLELIHLTEFYLEKNDYKQVTKILLHIELLAEQVKSDVLDLLNHPPVLPGEASSHADFFGEEVQH